MAPLGMPTDKPVY